MVGRACFVGALRCDEVAERWSQESDKSRLEFESVGESGADGCGVGVADVDGASPNSLTKFGASIGRDAASSAGSVGIPPSHMTFPVKGW